MGYVMLKSASRNREIAPFHVMDILARARNLETQGRDIVHMEVGELDFSTPAQITAAAQWALAEGKTFYTPALGLPELRQAISDFYLSDYGVKVPARRIVITAGASGALNLAMACLVEPGQEWLMTDPGYPCNRHFVRVFEGVPVPVPVGPETNFQLNSELLRRYWRPNTGGVLVASPSNPTGSMLSIQELSDLAAATRKWGGQLLVDEIYHGLSYETECATALAAGDDVWVIQSFSKYFQMTGWRLGWLVVPEPYVRDVEKLAQNLFIAPSTPAQYGALAAFLPETLAVLEERREILRQRRDFLAPALERLGLGLAARPEGAFYLWCDVSRLTHDSFALAVRLLEEAGVAATPGLDFGVFHPERYMRFAYAESLERLELGVKRLERYFGA